MAGARAAACCALRAASLACSCAAPPAALRRAAHLRRSSEREEAGQPQKQHLASCWEARNRRGPCQPPPCPTVFPTLHPTVQHRSAGRQGRPAAGGGRAGASRLQWPGPAAAPARQEAQHRALGAWAGAGGSSAGSLGQARGWVGGGASEAPGAGVAVRWVLMTIGSCKLDPAIRHAATTHPKQVFVTASTDTTVRLWDLRALSSSRGGKAPQPVATAQHAKGSQGAFFAPDGAAAAAGPPPPPPLPHLYCPHRPCPHRPCPHRPLTAPPTLRVQAPAVWCPRALTTQCAPGTAPAAWPPCCASSTTTTQAAGCCPSEPCGRRRVMAW